MHKIMLWAGVISTVALCGCAATNQQRAEAGQSPPAAASAFGETYLYVFGSGSGYSTLLKDHRVEVVDGVPWLVGTAIDPWGDGAVDWRGGNIVWTALDKIEQVVAMDDKAVARRLAEQMYQPEF